MKKIVHYAPNKYDHIRVGMPAIVYPIDHPDKDNVSNSTQVRTSDVVTVNADKSFETMNTRYVPTY